MAAAKPGEFGKIIEAFVESLGPSSERIWLLLRLSPDAKYCTITAAIAARMAKVIAMTVNLDLRLFAIDSPGRPRDSDTLL